MEPRSCPPTRGVPDFDQEAERTPELMERWRVVVEAYTAWLQELVAAR